MKKLRYIAIGLFLVLTCLFNVSNRFFGSTTLQGKSTAYHMGFLIGVMCFLVPAGILFYKAKKNSVQKCEKCGKKLNEDVNWRDKFGNPFCVCPECSTKNYDGLILEPALCSENLLNQIREKAAKERNIGEMFCLIPVHVVSCMVLFPEQYQVLMLLSIASLVIPTMLTKREKNISFDVEIEKSLLRLKSDSEYFNAVVEQQGIAKDCAWKKQQKELSETEIEVLSPEDTRHLFEEVKEISFIKKNYGWLEPIMIGCLILVMTGVFFIQNVFGLKASLPYFKEVAEKQYAYADVEQIMGTVAETKDGYFYATYSEDKFALVYIPNKDFEKYQEWMQADAAGNLQKTFMYGYVEKTNASLDEFVLEAFQYNYGDLITEETIDLMFGENYLVVKDYGTVMTVHLLKALYTLILGTICLVWGMAYRKQTIVKG